MADNFDEEIFTLADEDGNEEEYELLGQLEKNGKIYVALSPLAQNKDKKKGEEEEYVILRVELDENNEETLVTIDDDEEFDDIADEFDDEFSKIDYDEQ